VCSLLDFPDVGPDAAGGPVRTRRLHIDRAYLSSDLVRDRGPDLAIFCTAWRVRNTTGRFSKDQFSLGFAAGQLTCPAGVSMPFPPGKTVHFPTATCAACPLRQARAALLADESSQRQHARAGPANWATIWAGTRF
jgi:hypothetical protein